MHGAVARERLHEVLVQHRVRVLLGVHDPHDHVHETDHALDDLPVFPRHGVEVRQVQQHEPTARGARLAPAPGGRAQRGTHDPAVSDVEPVE